MENDPLLEGLRALPAPALDPATAERVRLRARAALAGGGARRALVPALVTSAAAAYLLWAAQFLLLLAR
jgi:hypothetical protein